MIQQFFYVDLFKNKKRKQKQNLKTIKNMIQIKQKIVIITGIGLGYMITLNQC